MRRSFFKIRALVVLVLLAVALLPSCAVLEAIAPNILPPAPSLQTPDPGVLILDASPLPPVTSDTPAPIRIEVVRTETPRPTDVPRPANAQPFVFAWMSDTQYYSRDYPWIFDKITAWLVENKAKLGLAYIFHTGDIVNNISQSGQWETADNAMKTLDGVIPYGVLAGNHDVGSKEIDYGHFAQYFGEKRFAKQKHYGGSYKDNRGHYDLIDAGGMSFVMAYMGWGVDDEALAWMDGVLSKYPNRVAILAFHNYLNTDGTRDETGEAIFEKLVRKHKNVYLVLCGHNHGAVTRKDTLDSRTVYQILADYQDAEEGGSGYLRLLRFDPGAKTLEVSAYSPYTDGGNPMGAEDTFTLPFP